MDMNVTRLKYSITLIFKNTTMSEDLDTDMQHSINLLASKSLEQTTIQIALTSQQKISYVEDSKREETKNCNAKSDWSLKPFVHRQTITKLQNRSNQFVCRVVDTIMAQTRTQHENKFN